MNLMSTKEDMKIFASEALESLANCCLYSAQIRQTPTCKREADFSRCRVFEFATLISEPLIGETRYDQGTPEVLLPRSCFLLVDNILF